MRRKKQLTIHEYELPITVEEDPSGGFVARCDSWADCYAQGDTLEEAINEISYVASSLIELYQEEDLPIPLKLKHTQHPSAANLRFTVPLIVSGY